MTVLQSRDSGQGKDLVLLHGWGMNSGIWEPLAARLRQHYRVRMIDLPGFGTNHDVMPERYDLDTVAQLVANKLKAPSILLGWSLGGLVAQRLALTYPERVSHLMTVASSPCFVADNDWPGIKPEVLEAFSHQLQSDAHATIDRFLAVQAMGTVSTKSDIQQLRAAIKAHPEPNPCALKRGLSILKDSDLRRELRRLSCPTLRLYGCKDSLVPVKALAEIERLQPNSTSVLFPAASHAPFISDLDSFEVAVVSWLKTA